MLKPDVVKNLMIDYIVNDSRDASLHGYTPGHDVYLFDNKFQEIIRLNKATRNYKKYLPFCVGSIVKGNIYNIFGKNRFNISRVLELSDIENDKIEYYKLNVHNAKMFFKTNYEDIMKCMNLQQ